MTEETRRAPGSVAEVAGETSTTASAAPAFPLSHAEIGEFAARSAALGRLLGANEVLRILAAYEREDQRATDAQRRFFRVAAHLNTSVLTTAVISAVILALGVLQPWLHKVVTPWFAQAIPGALIALGFIGLLAGGYAAARLYELSAGDLAGDWMRSRARAERLRSEYFDRIAARAAAADTPTQGAALELVITHLLKQQLLYFADRGKCHEEAAARWLRWAAFASGIASVGVAAGGMAGAAGEPWILAIAALGAIGGGVAAFAAAQEAIGQERQRAQRFRNNVDALELIARRIDDTRAAVAAGSSEALVTFTSAVNQQLALELGQFLEGGESIRAAINKLNEQIEDNRKRTAAVGGAEPAEKR
jgi:hypothetical protein